MDNKILIFIGVGIITLMALICILFYINQKNSSGKNRNVRFNKKQHGLIMDKNRDIYSAFVANSMSYPLLFSKALEISKDKLIYKGAPSNTEEQLYQAAIIIEEIFNHMMGESVTANHLEKTLLAYHYHNLKSISNYDFGLSIKKIVSEYIQLLTAETENAFAHMNENMVAKCWATSHSESFSYFQEVMMDSKKTMLDNNSLCLFCQSVEDVELANINNFFQNKDNFVGVMRILAISSLLRITNTNYVDSVALLMLEVIEIYKTGEGAI